MSRGYGLTEIRERDLVAAMLPAPAIPELLRDCWDAGAAVLPLDPALPRPMLETLLTAAAPTVVVDRSSASRRASAPAAEGDAVVIATSGTTGRPRLVVLQRTAITAAIRASAVRLQLQGSEAWLLCIPPWHVGGMLVVLRHLLLDAPLTVHDGFDLDAVAAAGDVRCMSLVPTQVRRLVGTGQRFDHLVTVLVGGDALDPGLRASAAAAGMPIVHTYGQSQSCGGVVYDGIALDGVGVAIGDDGEVLLAGPTLMRGYRGDDAGTAAAFDDARRLRTGDAGLLAADGRLVVTGRLDEVIVSGGEKVAPALVEDALRSVEGVAEVAVVGEPDAEWGSRVVAVVVPSDGATVTLDALRAAARLSLPAHALPRRLVIVDALPRTAAGKVRRSLLRERLGR